MLSLLNDLAAAFTGGNKPTTGLSRTTYRVRNIPERYNARKESQKVIETSLSTPEAPCTIKIRSFATNIDHNPTRTTITRTVTFDLDKAQSLRLKPNTSNEWTVQVLDGNGEATEDELVIDTRFNGFTVLSSPEDDHHEFDFIALSGLGSHAWGSFKKRGEKGMWLADKLPKNWSRTRIMIYGYQSSIMGTKSRQNLQDIATTFKNKLIEIRKSPNIAKRCVPLVFLAHSLGGLVLKQALVNLAKRGSTDPESQEVFQSVYAMLFFGVPCKGLDGQRLGLAAVAKGQSTEGFLYDLRHDSQMVYTLAQEFLKVFDGRNWVKIFSFYETMESVTAVMTRLGPSMTGPTEYWVGKDAAFNGRDIERQQDETYSIPIDTDHSGLVKCDKEDTFKTISHVLESLDWNIARTAKEVIAPFTGPPVASFADATDFPVPPDKKLTLMCGPTVQVYPVLLWGRYMYWPLSYVDNRVSTALLITDMALNIINWLQVPGARYIHQIVVNEPARKVHFIGQADQVISLSWEMLSAAPGFEHGPKQKPKHDPDLDSID